VPRINSSVVGLRIAELQGSFLACDLSRPSLPAVSKEPGFKSVASLADSRRYAELKTLISRERLLEKQQSYYLIRMSLNFSLLGLALTALFFVRNFGWQLVNAAFLGFVFTQMGFIVHDSGHHQILATDRRNDLLGIFHADLCLGFSYMRWVTTHNMHHGSPNQVGVDPDVDFPAFTFTESQTIVKRGFWRWIAKYQSYFFLSVTFAGSGELEDRLHTIPNKNQRQISRVGSDLLGHSFYSVLHGNFSLPEWSTRSSVCLSESDGFWIVSWPCHRS